MQRHTLVAGEGRETGEVKDAAGKRPACNRQLQVKALLRDFRACLSEPVCALTNLVATGKPAAAGRFVQTNLSSHSTPSALRICLDAPNPTADSQKFLEACPSFPHTHTHSVPLNPLQHCTVPRMPRSQCRRHYILGFGSASALGASSAASKRSWNASTGGPAVWGQQFGGTSRR